MTEIKYVGCQFVEPSDFVLDIEEGNDYLFLLTHTPAFFWVDGEVREYPAYSAILFHPGQKVYYRASGDKFINDWIRFYTTETYITETTLPRGIPFSVKDPDYLNKLVKLIFTEKVLNNSVHSYKELTIEYLMMVLMNKLKESCESAFTSPHYRKLLYLRKMISNNSTENWTVEKMSAYLHISPGYLQSLYKSFFGISCMDDVIRSRIRKAKEYLMLGQYSVSQVAYLCGYNSVEHFCRQFKKITGSTPSDYRSNVVKPAKQDQKSSLNDPPDFGSAY